MQITKFLSLDFASRIVLSVGTKWLAGVCSSSWFEQIDKNFSSRVFGSFTPSRFRSVMVGL